jgi:hypothetical protein
VYALNSHTLPITQERTLTFYRNKTDTVGTLERLSRKQCAASCCATPGCTHWQELSEKGCFHNDKNLATVQCEAYQALYTGGIKKNLVQILPTDILVKNSSVIILDRKTANKMHKKNFDKQKISN